MSGIRSKVTSKYQVTIPKEIRDMLHLGIADVIEWHVDKKGIRVEAAEKPFLKFHGYFKSEPGDVKDDVREAWRRRAERYR